MKKILSLLMIAQFMFSAFPQQLNYPQTHRGNDIDNYHGKTITDPYRWLEDENSQQTKEWVIAQNTITNEYLDKIPFRKALYGRLESLMNYERLTLPSMYEKTIIYTRNTGMQNQNPVYYKIGINGEEKLLLDPNKLSSDGVVSVSGYSLSKDERYFCYLVSKGGSDWNEAYVIDVQTGTLLQDKLSWIKFSGISWFGNGFFYSRYNPDNTDKALTEQNRFHSVYFHKLNTAQKEDILIYRNNDEPLRTYSASTDQSQQYLFLSETKSTSNNSLYFKKTDVKNGNFIPLTKQDFANEYSFVGMIGKDFLIMTNEDAPNYRLMLVNPEKPERVSWKEFLPQQNYVIQQVDITKDYVAIVALEKAYNKVFIYNFKGVRTGEIELPGIGSISGISGNNTGNTVFYSYMSYTYPSSVFMYNIETGKNEVFFRPELKTDFTKFTTIQVEYLSKDGTKVPMFITMKKDLVLNGNNPTLLYGYGGFNISLTPRFSTTLIPFLENGGVYAVANIRGGGEFGREWHVSGTKLQKQNVFDDFIAAAEYLIKKSYTNSGRLAIQGGSNGGLLVGACMTQRPDLFKVALPAVGVMDMLRFHKFTIGWAWVDDYGSSEVPEEFEYILKYSPLHNIKPGIEYPATLVTTADHDDRVVPAHSYKFISELQHCQKGNSPVLIRIETQAGHGAGKPVSKIIEEAADVNAFMMYNLGMKPVF